MAVTPRRHSKYFRIDTPEGELSIAEYSETYGIPYTTVLRYARQGRYCHDNIITRYNASKKRRTGMDTYVPPARVPIDGILYNLRGLLPTLSARTKYYANIKHKGMSPAEALNAAQVSTTCEYATPWGWLTKMQLARKIGLYRNTLEYRLENWSLAHAMNTPAYGQKGMHLIFPWDDYWARVESTVKNYKEK